MGITIKSVKTKESNKFTNAINKMDGVVAKVGWFGKYPDKNISVADVALTQEYGVAKKNIPPRPFLQPTIDAKEASWKSLILKGCKAVLRGATTIDDVMEIVGQTAKADIQKTIARVSAPPLAQSTIKARMRRAGISSVDSSKFGNKYNFSKIKRAASSGKSNINLIDKPLIDTGYLFSSIINVIEHAGQSKELVIKK